MKLPRLFSIGIFPAVNPTNFLDGQMPRAHSCWFRLCSSPDLNMVFVSDGDISFGVTFKPASGMPEQTIVAESLQSSNNRMITVRTKETCAHVLSDPACYHQSLKSLFCVVLCRAMWSCLGRKNVDGCLQHIFVFTWFISAINVLYCCNHNWRHGRVFVKWSNAASWWHDRALSYTLLLEYKDPETAPKAPSL